MTASLESNMPGGNITIEKTLPNSIESERAVLGAIILDHEAIFPATEVLTVDDFYLEGHREIFRAMLALAEEETSIDLFTLREELRRRSKEEAAGGPAYVASLTDGLPSGLNVGHYAKTVREKATSRQLIQLSNELMWRCYEGEERPAEILEKTESRIFQIAAREIKGRFQPARELADAAYKEIEEAAKHKRLVAGIDTGFAELNRMTGGFHNQNLVVVAARPGIGKTSFCLNIACRAAMKDGKHIGIFSLEMSKPEIMKRMISSESEVEAHRIQSGYLNQEDWMKIGQATARLSDAPIYVDDSANLTMLQVRAKAQRLALEHGIDLLVVDYLQLVSGSGRRYENRTQEVTEISRGLKNLAKELDIPVIAVSQLNREVEKRSGGRRPQLSDLRESGAIEQDADLVLFISNDETPYASGGDSIAEITIGKQRNGMTGSFQLSIRKRITKFSDLQTPGKFPEEQNLTEQTRNGTAADDALSRTPEVLLEIYKAENHKLPQVLEFGPERRDKCRRRLAKDPKKFIDQFTRAVIKAQETPFLCGEGDRGWKADFDWLIANDRNVIRVLEGRYDTGARASPGNAGATVFDKIRKEREERNHGSDRVA